MAFSLRYGVFLFIAALGLLSCGVTDLCSDVQCSQQNVTGSSCVAGACQGTCNAGFDDCNRDLQKDGCEAALQSDPVNCGACGKRCSGNHIANPVCVDSLCAGTCEQGWSDCNKDKLADGCEARSDDSLSNCGGCGKACSRNHVSTPMCQSGLCTGACDPGFLDCNNDKLDDGCETDPSKDIRNCGGCGKVCSTSHATPACSAGVCSGLCDLGFADCNNNKLSDGCETATMSDASNCGGCGKACSNTNISTPSCTLGQCSGACNAGFADCNNNKLSDGCETATMSDASNCGGCGVKCPSNTCSAGKCVDPTSCLALHTANPTLPSGVYQIDPDGAGAIAPFNAYCDMATDGGGWTYLATVTNNGDAANTGSWLHGSPTPNRWEGTDTFGVLDPSANADYRSAAFHTVPGKAVMITHRNLFLLRTNDSCLGDVTLRARFVALDWTCGGSSALAGVACSHACTLAASTPRTGDTAMLNGAARTSLYFKAGEANGAQDTNRDRNYLSTNARDNVDYTMGLGCQCSGIYCSPRSGDADVTDYTDGVQPTAGTEFYGIWIR